MAVRTRAAGTALACAAVAAGAPSPASGAAVYGGSTSAGAAIVVNADRQAKRLRSAVVSWTATCDDGRRFPMAVPLEAVRAEPGFDPGFRELATSRNGKGRFAGVQLGGLDMGDTAGILRAEYAGRLTAKRARGTLDATITVLEKAGGSTVATCRTGSVRWSATRSPGRVFGGSTMQDMPIVVRLDAKRRLVADFMVAWETSTCKPDGLYAMADERLGNFAIDGGRFGEAFDRFYEAADGGEGKASYDVTGRVGRRRAGGSLRVTLAETDPAGAVTAACDSGVVPWSATTG